MGAPVAIGWLGLSVRGAPRLRIGGCAPESPAPSGLSRPSVLRGLGLGGAGGVGSLRGAGGCEGVLGGFGGL